MIRNAGNMEHGLLHVMLLMQIRTLVEGGGDAAAGPQQQLDLSQVKQGFELSKYWPCLPMDGNVSTVHVYVYVYL